MRYIPINKTGTNRQVVALLYKAPNIKMFFFKKNNRILLYEYVNITVLRFQMR